MSIPGALAGDFLSGPGTGSLGGPPVQHNYKRAVCRAPPAVFDVEVLVPAKFGSGYCYGMRIYPVTGSEVPDDQSARSSKSSGSMNTEYDIWRRWEDCLWFQEILESEYALMARQKRQRLAAGKGVKKNGMYIHSDQAASFESLPPGPEASSVAKDIHEILPKMSKKGTFFKASQATVEQRGKEFRAMIETLWGDQVPTLIKELRETRLVRDFFGYWRRDKDHDRKIMSQIPGSSENGKASSRSSFAASTLSMYFSPSTVDLPTMPPSPSYASHIAGVASAPRVVQRSPSKSPHPQRAPYEPTVSSSSGATSPTLIIPDDTPTPTGMQFSISHRGSLKPHSPVPLPDDESAELRPASSGTFARSSSKHESKIGLEDMPIVFMPDGQPWSETAINGQAHERHAGLQALPEDDELVADMNRMSVAAANSPPRAVPTRRARNNSWTNRNCVVVPAVPALDDDTDADSQTTGDTIASSSRPSSVAPSMFSDFSGTSSWRSSVASETSIATISTSHPRESFLSVDTDSSGSIYSQGSMHGQNRVSIATMNSLVSGFSVDAVLPRTMSPPPNGSKRSKSMGSRRTPSALSGGPLSAEDVHEYEQQDEVLDAYFDDGGPRTPSPTDLTFPIDHHKYQQPTKQICPPEYFPKPFQNRPPGQFHLPWSVPNSPGSRDSVSSVIPSSTYSTASLVSSNGTAGTALTIKAMLDDSLIVLVRATHTAPFLDVRERIRTKFAKQEGVLLPDSFVIGYAPASERARAVTQGRGRARSNSTPALSRGAEAAELLRIIASEEEWQTAIAGVSAKLTVRILRSRP